ncbi:MAG: hypothetical protein RLZ98_2068 [Pseudomonadota bacterium]|jgi:hypothetical protein
MQRALARLPGPASLRGLHGILPRGSALDFQLDQLRSILSATGGTSFNMLLFVLTVLAAGVGSSWYMVSTGTSWTTNRIGPWTEWPTAGKADADPYTKARIVRYGILPLSGRIAATFEARYDSGGQRLHSSCEYVIRSQPLKANWWSIAVYDSDGLLIPNAANRYGFNSSTVISRPDASFIIALAREARAGNWLPIAGAGRLTLVLTLIQPARSEGQAGVEFSNNPDLDLPDIERVYCR